MLFFNLHDTVEFRSFSYTPRQESGVNRNVKGYELWIANTDSEEDLDFASETWSKVAEGNFDYNSANPIFVVLPDTVSANQIKFVCTSSNNGEQFAAGAEFNLYEPGQEAVPSFRTSDLTLKENGIHVENTSAVINDHNKTGKKVSFAFAPYTFHGVEYTITENIVMYEGDHFMRKYLEISVPQDQKEQAVFDYIDLEAMMVNEDDQQWTTPTDTGGTVNMERYKAHLGQPIYIQGMFFGCEFPATDTQIVDSDGRIRYYTGKSFDRLEKDAQAAADNKGNIVYNTWQTVAGSARSTEQEVIQSDFFEYIDSISVPSEFRIQYNSWFDNMMLIDDQSILQSFIEVDRELNKVETRPLDSYVVDDGWNNYNYNSIVDASRTGTTLNESGFWEFNSKFPEGLTPSSELVQKFGSNFGLWVGPRGGYQFMPHLANILIESGKGSLAGGSVDVADRTYIKYFGDMAIDFQKEYGVNYWKWDGFANIPQYNAFPATDGLPGYQNNHMIGGYHNMYHVTDLWEAWIDMLERVRKSGQAQGIEDLWISLTCYINPSPWWLQWANSLWMQCNGDRGESGHINTKMDLMLTYRDACYYDFITSHEFQFPLKSLYNHDPVYGKEGTGLNINSMSDEEFKNYLYTQSGRGTSFWELYYSDSIMTEEKYEATGEFLSWAEENFHILQHAKLIGGNPSDGMTLETSYTVKGNGGDAYAFSAWDGEEGIITMRNSDVEAKELTFTMDRNIGMSEGLIGKDLYRTSVHNFKAPENGDDAYASVQYGDEITVTLQPGEVRVWKFDTEMDTKVPEFARAFTNGKNELTVKFNEKVQGALFDVARYDIASIHQSVDDITYRITLTKVPEDGEKLTITAKDITDLSGNKIKDNEISAIYHNENIVAKVSESALHGTKTISEEGLISNNGFTVSAKINTKSTGALISQDDSYVLGVNADGTVYFTLNGATAIAEAIVNDGKEHIVTGVKENNGMLKLYVDGELNGSSYKAENRYFDIVSSDITMGNRNYNGMIEAAVYDTAYGYHEVGGEIKPVTATKDLAVNKNIHAKWTETENDEGMNYYLPIVNMVNGNNSNVGVHGQFGNDFDYESSYVEIDLGKISDVEELRLYRYWRDGRTYNGTVIALSENEQFTDPVVVYNSDSENKHGFGKGTEKTYAETSSGLKVVLDEKVKARYVRLYMYGSNLSAANHVVELEVYGYQDLDTNVSDLIRILAELNEIDESGVTQASTVKLREAIKEGYRVLLADASQEEISQKAEDLKMVALQLVYINDLMDLIKEIEVLDYDVYTKDSWNAVTIALEHANTVLADEMASQEDVNEAIDALHQAIAALAYKAADYHAVDAAIEKAKGLDPEDYLDFTKVVKAIEAVVRDKNITEQAEVDAMAKVIEDAIDALEEKQVVEPVDKSELKELLESIAELNEDAYTKDSWAIFTEALNKAEAVYADESAELEDVIAATESLRNAIDALEKQVVEPVDKSELKELLENIAELNEDAYTKDSWAVFTEALNKAEAVYADESADLEDVKTVTKSLRNAVDALEKIEEMPPTEPTTPEEEASDAPETQEKTETGDSTNVGILLALLGIAGTAILGTRKRVK